MLLAILTQCMERSVMFRETSKEICADISTISYQAFSTLGRNIDITTQDACSFYNQVSLYDNFGGVVMDECEGQNIAKALGSNGKGE